MRYGSGHKDVGSNMMEVVHYPTPSMYGIFTYIWLFLVINYGKCR